MPCGKTLEALVQDTPALKYAGRGPSYMKKPHMDEYVNGIHLWWGRLYNAFLGGGIPVETHTCEVQETALQEGQLHRTELT